MTRSFLYPLIAADGPLVGRVMDEVRRTGAAVWPDGATASQTATRAAGVLLLAGSATGNILPRLLEAQDARRPLRAVVLDDGGAALVSGLGLWGESIDFRIGFEVAFAKLRVWLVECGLAPEIAEPVKTKPIVFISYPRRDEAIARRLSALLGMIGWDAWYYHGPERDREVESVCLEIDERIKDAVGVLILLSEEWDTSKYCRSEWEKADRTNKRWLILKLRPSPDRYRLSDRLPVDLTRPEAVWWPELANALSRWKEC